LDNHIDVYKVTMFERAYRDLDSIYDYIANTLIENKLVGVTPKANLFVVPHYPALSTFTRHFFTQTATHLAQPVHFS